MGHRGSKHHMHHRRWMRHSLRRQRRRFGPPGRGPRGGAFLRDFLEDNPECAEQLARYSVARMRDDGMTDEEIRDHLDHAQHHGFGAGLDIDDLVG